MSIQSYIKDGNIFFKHSKSIVVSNSVTIQCFFISLKRGYFPGPHDQALHPKIVQFHSELKHLEQLETMLDQHTFWVEQSIKDTKEDCNQYPFEKPIIVYFLLPFCFLYLKTRVHLQYEMYTEQRAGLWRVDDLSCK